MALKHLTLALLLTPCALASTDPFDGPRVLNTRFSYKASVPNAGEKPLDLWIPIPSDSEIQKITNLKVSAPGDYRITTEGQYGNRMVYIHSDRPSSPFEVTVSVDVARMTGGVDEVRRDQGNSVRFLAADRLVPVTGKFATIADGVVHGATNAEKMKAIYDHVVATMQYDYKKESPKLGDGDVAFVCDYKKGNCSDLHSYVISLARAEGIPCYLEFGFPISGIPIPDPIPITGKISGYHCWTWFYDDAKGWIVLDASDGRRWLDSNRPDQTSKLATQLVLERSAVAYSKGRDITLSPPQKGASLNNFIYPYAEAAGERTDAEWEITFERLLSG